MIITPAPPLTLCRTHHTHTRDLNTQELSIGQIKFKAFDLGGHEVARRVWKDYYAKVDAIVFPRRRCRQRALCREQEGT